MTKEKLTNVRMHIELLIGELDSLKKEIDNPQTNPNYNESFELVRNAWDELDGALEEAQ